MNINRNNYEEYFLLYADKELSADEKSMVEIFVKQNADLEEEFVMLQQSVVKPDAAVRLADKNFLYKNEGFIDKNNYEEKFLLYTDNELNLSEIEETEKFVLSNPSLQNEFTLLQQVKYEPDTSIGFPDKNLLFKKEDTGKVIPFRWKVLAAAVLLGVGLWTGISYLQKNRTDIPVAIKQTPLPRQKNPVRPVEQKENENSPLVRNEKHQNVPSPKVVHNELDNSDKKEPVQNITVKNVRQLKKPEVNIPEKKNDDIALVDVPVKTDVIKTNDLPQPINTTSEPNDRTAAKIPVLQNNNYALPASYIAEAEVKSENYVFYNITTEEFKKSKVGNFLKKVKRAIESKIPFKNNSFKIGNVEIAKDDQN